MNLEIDDYLKTIENLNERLQNKESEIIQLKSTETSMSMKQKNSQDEIGVCLFIL